MLASGTCYVQYTLDPSVFSLLSKNSGIINGTSPFISPSKYGPCTYAAINQIQRGNELWTLLTILFHFFF